MSEPDHDKQWEVLPPEDGATGGGNRTRPDDGRSHRLATAMAIAVVSDVASVWLELIPPVQWALDLATAGLLFLILGRQWAILPALVAEAVPGLAAFPAWVLVVASIGVFGTVKPGPMR